MSLGNDLRLQGFEEVQLPWDGQTVRCNEDSFQALVEQQPQFDLSGELGSDSREVVYIHVKDPPAISRGDILILEDETRVRVVSRDDNPSNLVTRFTATKIVPGKDND